MNLSNQISVVSVDDNEDVADALRILFGREQGFQWKGARQLPDELFPFVADTCPDVLLLDLDMSGFEPFTAIRELSQRCPSTRVIVFSGHVRKELVENALEAGAWGYISKADGEDVLIEAVRRVAKGEEVMLGPEARAIYSGV